MATRQQIIDDIELRLYASKPSDDIDFSSAQVGYIVDKERDRILTEKLNAQIRNKEQIEPFYIVSDTNLSLTEEVLASDDPSKKNRYSVTLTRNVLPLFDDGGIIRVVNNFGFSLAHTDQNEVEVFRDLPYGGATNKDQLFYRENRNLFIEASSELVTDYYNYNAYYIPTVASLGLSDTDDYPLEDSLVSVLTDSVELIMREQMQLGIGDLDNDGTDPYQLV